MSRSDTYNTRQKELILDVIKGKKGEFTVQDIYNCLNNKTGLTTIYRLIDKLVSEGYVKKYIRDNNKVYYQYIEKCEHQNHFYLKCSCCGSLIHIDCDCIEELTSHIFSKHKFKLNKENIIIDGLCKNCYKRS